MTSSSVWPELGRASPSDLVSGFAVAPREPFFAPWAAISDVRIVRGRAATRTMVRLATTASAEASTYPGYFPNVGRPLLTFRVDPEPVTFAPHFTSMTPSLTWAVPVKRLAPVLAALSQHGFPEVGLTDEMVRPTFE